MTFLDDLDLRDGSKLNLRRQVEAAAVLEARLLAMRLNLWPTLAHQRAYEVAANRTAELSGEYEAAR
jgi:hypothetical protein